MDLREHTATLPMNEYNDLILSNKKLQNRIESAEDKLHLIKEVIYHPNMDRIKRFDKIKTILEG